MMHRIAIVSLISISLLVGCGAEQSSFPGSEGAEAKPGFSETSTQRLPRCDAEGDVQVAPPGTKVDVSPGCRPVPIDPASAAPPEGVKVIPVAEPNRIGVFAKAQIERCNQASSEKETTSRDAPPDPLLCKLVQAQEAGLIVPGEQLSNRELRDVVARIGADSRPALDVDAVSALPLLEECLSRVGNGKPPLAQCEWPLAHRDEILKASG